MSTLHTGQQVMLGKTWKPWKLFKGRPPCGCWDCDQLRWGHYKHGKDKRADRRSLRHVAKAEFRSALQNLKEE